MTIDTPLENSSLNNAVKAHREYLLKSDKEELSKAINYYIDAIKINPNLSSAYYRLAFLLYNKGEIAILSAIEQCEKAVELDEKDPDAHTYLGYFLSLNKDFDKAKKEFHKAIKLNPNKARIRLIMAITCLEKIKNSINLSDSIKAIYYGFSGGLLGLFDFLSLKMLLKNINKNIKFLKACIKGKFLEFVDEKKAYNLYLNTVDNSNKSIKMYEKMAKIAIRKFSYDKAFDCFENVRVISKNDPEKIVNAIEFVEKYQNEKTDTLIDYYNLLINHYPKLSRCYFELGNLYLKKEDKLNSLSAFLIALKLEPNNPYYENSVAYSYVQLEKYDMAIEYYNKALIDIKKTPNPEWEAVIYQALASLYHNVKSDSLEAVSSLENALCLTKNTSQVYEALGDIYYDNTDFNTALEYYELAYKENKNNPKLLSRIAMLLWEDDEIERSIVYYLKAIELDNEYDIAYNNLGVVYLDGLGDFDKAKECFLNALNISPDYVLARFNLGRIYEAQSKNIEAAKNYQIALNINKIKQEIDSDIITQKLYALFET